MMSPIETELVAAYLDVDAAEAYRNEAAKRANTAVLAARAAGLTPSAMARLVGKDRTTIEHRINRARKAAP